MSDKIINTFQQRRQLAQAIEELANTHNEAELIEAARGIVHAFPADLVINSLIANLDTPSSQIRGGLGHIATLLSPDEVTPALRGVVANRQNPPQSRVTAALLMERFLGEELPPAMLGDLSDGNDVAFQSLREAVEEGARNRHVLLEYVTQMRQTDEEIAFMVMELLARLPDSSQVEMLRLIALDDRSTVAANALGCLVQMGGGIAKTSVARALHTLGFTLPPALAQHATRSVRKLAFGGVHHVAPSPSGWHALISPVDVAGNQSLWFVYRPSRGGSAQGVLVGLIINEHSGLLRAFGSDAMQAADLPAPKGIGQMISVEIGGGVTSMMLEAPLDFGRWLLQQALAGHWSQEPLRPLPDEYKLYNDLIWQFDAPQVDATLLACYASDHRPNNGLLSAEQLDTLAGQLLAHPIMASWSLQNRLVFPAVGPDILTRTGLTAPQMVTVILREMDGWSEKEQFLAAVRSGLQGQAAWLRIEGDETTAQLALTLANHTTMTPSQNPLVARLVASGIEHSFAPRT